MTRERSRRLLKIAVLLFVISVEAIALFWIDPGWMALASGFVGSVLLIIPPLRIEWAKGARTHLRRLGKALSEELAEHREETKAALIEEIEQEYPWDAYLLILGGIFLAFYFLLQIPYKMELVDRATLERELLKFKFEQTDPLKR